MNLVKFNPTVPGNSLFDEFFNNFFETRFPETKMKPRFSEPLINVYEEKDAFKMELAVPGLTKDDIKIDIENDQITIQASKEHKEETDEKNFSRKEFYFGQFTRTFFLPESVDRDHIQASFENGILHVEMKKKEEAIAKGPKQIEIR